MASSERVQVSRSAPRLTARRSSRGVVMVEYALLLVLVGVPVMVGTAAAGVALVKGYGNMRNDQLHRGP